MNKLRMIISYLFLTIIIFIFANILITNWHTLSTWTWHFNIFWFFLATIFLTAFYLLAGKGAQLALSLFSEHQPYKTILAMRSFTELGRYVPGKVWKYLGRIQITKQLNIRASIVAVAMIIEEICFFLGAAVISLFAIGYLSTILIDKRILSLVFLMIIAGIILVYWPRFWHFIINKFLAFMKKEPLTITWPVRNINKILGLYCIIWVMHGFAFYSFVRAITPLPLTEALWISSIYVLAWLLAYATLISPGGIGIREGLLTLGLSFWIPEPSVALLIATLSRVWIMLIEFSLGFWGWRYITPLLKKDT